MDWGLFHADPGFHDTWRRYDMALRHRNAALRTHATDRAVDAWDGELAITATHLDLLRKTFCEALGSVLEPLTVAILGDVRVEVVIAVAGRWSRLNGISRCGFGQRRDQDHQQGHTRLGPHAPILQCGLPVVPPAEALSRGVSRSCWSLRWCWRRPKDLSAASR